MYLSSINKTFVQYLTNKSKFSYLAVCFLALMGTAYGQNVQNNFVRNQPNRNLMANSTAFRQEIARMEINVSRLGHESLPIAQVPRLQKNDVLKVRLLDEPINGLKPDQSNYDWTFLIAYINPGMKNDGARIVSKEVNFRRSGWYKEHSFVVPYDSQPIAFLYPKPQYRSKILKLIKKNQEDIRKIGEKTIEISDAYGKISMFLNELQGVVNRNYYNGGYGSYPGTYSNGGGVHSGNYYQSNPNYGGYYGNNQNILAEQAVERVAKSFNINLPNCWNGAANGVPGAYRAPGGYRPNNTGYYNPYQNRQRNDLMGRIQCVAKGVNIADFDYSIAKMFQQGGVLLASQLARKYPQLAIWINIAAAAIDFIVKFTNRAPLRIIPAVVSSNSNLSVRRPVPGKLQNTGKFSLFAESQPRDNGFVTAYPMVFNKWQASADPATIGLPMPVLMDSCLHVGQNIIRTTDVINDWMNDKFTKDFQFTLTSRSGFQKKFNLKKNVGYGGWAMLLTKADLDAIPKINMALEGYISGSRGFSQIESPRFRIQMGSIQGWAIEPSSKKSFSAGGKRTVVLRNQKGNCRCLDAVIYKPGFGGEFVFDSKKLNYSPNGKDVSFEIDTSNFSVNRGMLELHQLGGEKTNLPISLFGKPPTVAKVKLAKGDHKVTIFGDRLEQVNAVIIGGKKATSISDKAGVTANVHALPANKRVSLREKIFTFENSSPWTGPNEFSLELSLVGDRIIKFPTRFTVSSSRPKIVSNPSNEIEGYAISDMRLKSSRSIETLPVFPIEAAQIGVNIQNSLIDHDFKVERLRIEARIEDTPINPFSPPDVSFEVLDWRTLRLNIVLNEQTKRLVAGRRIQFRIFDAQRGYSDWYTINRTFVRTPKKLSLKCRGKECVLTGKGIAYIQQVSLDNGKSWFPQSPVGLIPTPIGNGLERVTIPNTRGKKLMKVKLRDYQTADGLRY